MTAPTIDDTTTHATHRVLFGAVAVGTLVLDQVTKAWARSALADRDIDLVWTLRFRLLENHAAAFSLGAGFGAWFAVLAVLVVGVLVWKGRSVDSRVGAIALGLIVGGALGNVMDRLVRAESGFLSGGVTDFIDLQWWPVFNMADMAVVCGAILLSITFLRAPEAR